MKRIGSSSYLALVVLIVWPSCLIAQSVQAPGAPAAILGSTTAAVPPLVRYSAALSDTDGKPLTGIMGVTFSLYKDEQGGPPLWVETQNVQPDKTGHYTVMLGSTSGHGLSSEIFASGEARWIGVKPEGQPERPRVLLLSVPYALKAADAQTLGGKPVAALMLATDHANAGASFHTTDSAAPVTPLTVQGSGTLNFLPIWTGRTTLGNSVLFQSAGKLGIGTTTPATTLDVKGNATIRGNQTITGSLSATGNISGTGSISGQTASFVGSTGSLTNLLSVVQKGSGTAISGFASATIGVSFAVSGFASSPSEVGVSGEGGTGILGIGYASSGGTGVFGSGKYGVQGTSSVSSGAGGVFTNTATGEALSAQINGREVFGVYPGDTVVNGVLVVGGKGALMIQGGDPGCDSGFAGIGFVSLSGCNSYSMIGDGKNTYLNRPLGGSLFVRENNGTQMTIAPGGSVSIASASTLSGFPSPTISATSMNGGSGGSFSGGNSATSGGFARLGLFALGGGGSNGAKPGDGGDFCGGSANRGVVVAGAGIFAVVGSQSGDVCRPGDGIVADVGSGSALADSGFFNGDVEVTGTLSANSKNFKIDHPLDPANKYLYHASVESSKMMNIHSGNVVLDSSGEAAVVLPDWFEALNHDFRPQLTCLGGFAPVYIAQEIEHRSFRIGGGYPGLKVSWQITGIRHDAYAKAHPVVAEVDKRGT